LEQLLFLQKNAPDGPPDKNVSKKET